MILQKVCKERVNYFSTMKIYFKWIFSSAKIQKMHLYLICIQVNGLGNCILPYLKGGGGGTVFKIVTTIEWERGSKSICQLVKNEKHKKEKNIKPKYFSSTLSCKMNDKLGLSCAKLRSSSGQAWLRLVELHIVLQGYAIKDRFNISQYI